MGILIGATLELIFLGNVAIGAAHPPDIVTGSVLATAFFRSCPVVVQRLRFTIAIPVSMLAQTLGILVRVVNARFGHLADRYAAQGNTRMVGLMHLAGPTLPLFFKRISTGIFCHSAWFFGGKLVPGGHSAGDNQWIDRRQQDPASARLRPADQHDAQQQTDAVPRSGISDSGIYQTGYHRHRAVRCGVGIYHQPVSLIVSSRRANHEAK